MRRAALALLLAACALASQATMIVSSGPRLFVEQSGGSAFPTWYPESAGTIVEIDSGTTIQGVAAAAGANSYGGSDPDNITDNWSGGTVVYVSGLPYLVVHGGGHSDGAWNGMLKFGPLYGEGSDAPTWTIFLAASASSAVQNGCEYTDGRQTAVHTYNNIAGVGDTLYALSTAARYSDGFTCANTYATTPAGQTQLTSNPLSGDLYGAATYHDGNIYYFQLGTSTLRVYNISGDSWSAEPNAATDVFQYPDYIASAVDTTRGMLMVASGAAAATWNLSNLARTTGRATPSAFDVALEYDPGRDAFVSLVDDEMQVAELDAGNLAGSWSARTFTGDDPGDGVSRGTYGRFRYVDELNGYIHAPCNTCPVYFWRSE